MNGKFEAAIFCGGLKIQGPVAAAAALHVTKFLFVGHVSAPSLVKSGKKSRFR